MQFLPLKTACPLLQFDNAKVRTFDCGSRILHKKFFIFLQYFFFPEYLDKNCCSVAVLQFSRSYSHTLKILLYLYINIELIFDFRITYFGTATLQQLQHVQIQIVVCKQLFFWKVLVVCNIFIIFATYYYKVHAYDARRTSGL